MNHEMKSPFGLIRNLKRTPKNSSSNGTLRKLENYGKKEKIQWII